MAITRPPVAKCRCGTVSCVPCLRRDAGFTLEGGTLLRSFGHRSCEHFGSRAQNGPNRSTVDSGAGPAARILSPSPNATNGAIRATRREAWVTGFDCGAGGGISRALPHRPDGIVPSLIDARAFLALFLPRYPAGTIDRASRGYSTN
jgi:hypothetical protein